jgi:hypothetical protein
MLDVHPPHSPTHTWKDFFIHVGTITVGLLIALSLEAAVESFRHAHERREMRQNLHEEILESQKQLPRNLESVEGERHELEANLVMLRKLRAHQTLPPGSKLNLSWYWSSMPDAAWQTAHETGQLALLSSNQVQGYSGLYGQQALVNSAGIALSRGLTEAQIPLTVEPDLNALPPALIDELIRSCATNFNQIEYVEVLAKKLGPNYKEALGKL